ncbi:MAG: class I SAM-dependent methyltransferase [Acholeplasmataceae bacterium]|nr:class I SAM-dependent methyltransferase [Acholeplasmataceae bacterium]
MYHHFSEFYNQLFPFDPQIKDFIRGFIKPSQLAIDLGSGTGRLTKLISDFGMDVIGIDLDETMVDKARKYYPEINFRVGDMVEVLKEEKKYDLMTCFGNTLVHLNHLQLKTFFKETKEKLSSQGYMIVQVLNYIKILKEKPKELKELEYNDLILNRYYDYKEKNILFTTKISIGNQESIGSTTLYPYTIESFLSLFKELGLKSQFFGDLKLKPFEDSDYYLYIVITQS